MRTKEVHISILNFEGADLSENPDFGTATILRNLADKIVEVGLENLPAVVRDANGNPVGSVTVVFTF